MRSETALVDPMLAERLARLSPEQRAFVEQRLRDARAEREATIPYLNLTEAPLSFAQEVLWDIERSGVGLSAYNVPAAMRVSGPLDITKLQRALDALVRRHSALRTTFGEHDGHPVQIIRDRRPVPLRVIDTSAVAPNERDVYAAQQFQKAASEPFDLSRDLLLRATLLRFAAQDHALLLIWHHVASDLPSREILLRDLARFYGSPATEATASSPAPLQYADFAAWQRKTFGGAELERLRMYWSAQLVGAPAVLDLPTDRPRSGAPAFAGERREFEIPSVVAEGIAGIARAHGTTTFIALLVPFGTLLHRYTGQESIVVGSVLAGRGRAELEDVVGYFARTVPIVVDFAADPTFEQLLATTHERYLDVVEYADVPLEMLGLPTLPRLASLFTLVDGEAALPALDGLTLAPMGLDRGVAKFELSLAARLMPHALGLEAEYRTDLFDAATIDRLLSHFRTLLEGIVANPGRRISELPLLAVDERRFLVNECNATVRPYPSDLTLLDLLKAQASCTPSAIALVWETSHGTAHYTYAELHERAAVLARRLRTLGVEPGVGVAVCIERGPELMVATLAVLEAGGYYVPFDPDYPKDRLAFMLEDSQVAVLLTQSHLVSLLPPNGATIAVVDNNVAPESDARTTVARNAGPSDPAYMIYTSGSTGRPKGALNSHAGIVNRLLWMNERWPLGHQDVIVQKTPYSFDVSVWELFWPLMAGARLVMARPGGHRDPAYLVDVIERHGVTIAHFVPSMLGTFLADPGVSRCISLRHVMCSGEALPAELVPAFYALLGAELHNLYGPTEAAVDVTHWACPRNFVGPTVPIGRPIANTQIYILDQRREPTPIGVAGELYIGGVQVGLGYHRRPELTAEKFVPDRFAAADGARLYRTGDSARYRADGTIEYLGRLDDQVKLRGFRIELGEIESALGDCAGVRQAVAAVREDTAGDPRLVAYVVSEREIDGEGLRAALGKRLPGYMVPGAIARLAALPLSSNGKLDRRALPAPEVFEPRERTIVAPRNAGEATVRDLFAAVLGTTVDRVSMDDDFFALGGHSLLAMRLVGRIRSVFGVTVSLRAFFENATPTQLAQSVSAFGSAHDGEASPIARRPSQDEAPLTPAQEVLWLFERSHPRSSAYLIRAARRLHGHLDERALRSAVDALVERHAALRTTFFVRDRNAVQRICAPRPVLFETVDFATLPDDAREGAALRHVQAFACQPFDLERDLLLRALLVRMSEDDHLFLIVSHHIVTDGTSFEVLFRDLAEIYAAQEAARTSALAPLPIEFVDYAAWQREQLSGPSLSKLSAYWDAELAGRPTTLALPLDRPRGSLPAFIGGHHTAILPDTLLDGLRRVSRRNDVTLYTVLLAAYATLLHRYTGQSDVVIGSPFAGRGRRELEDIVGYFVSMLPLRARFEGDPGFTHLLRAVRETTLGALEHQDAPYDVLEAAGAGKASGSPYQTVFILQNAAKSGAKLGSLSAAPFGFETSIAKVDLTLSVTEWDDALRVSFEYRTDLLEPSTVERMFAHFRTLLEGIVTDSSRPVSALPLLTADERRYLIAAPNATVAEYPRDMTLPEVIDAQVAANPHACAIVADDRSLSYEELSTRAEAFARRLRASGVQPGTFVGICLERSSDMFVALLGVLRAGAAYVPLDPAFPPARLTFMLGDCGAAAVVTQASLRSFVESIVAEASAPATSYAPGICCIDETDDTPVAADHGMGTRATATDLAYVLYTSGSTGRPKGVCVTHRSLVNLLTSMAHEPGLTADDTWLAVTTLSFDMAGPDLWLPLIVGARIALASRVAVADGHLLAALLASSRATVLQATPATWRLLLAAGWAGDPNLTMLCGGEALPPNLAAELLPRGRALWNMYGPTETTIWSTAQHVRPGEPISLGNPIANTQLYVLEPGGDLAPLGVAGELCIGGDGVSNGYLHRPELTAERFIADPFRPRAGARLYRTGDRVRRHADGRLEYLGRLDNQVKVRGFRIELGEIDAALRAYPGVANAAAALRSDEAQEPRIVGYYVPHAPGGGDDGAPPIEPMLLREHVRTLLPGYMVPKFLVRLDALPLTPNGKIDREALPAPNANDLALTRTAFVAPQTAVEATIVRLVGEILGRDEVGMDDDFFELGGHSLAAMRLLSRVAIECDSRLSLREFFENPTAAALAATLERSSRNDRAVDPITRRTDDGPAPLSYGQELLWLHEQATPGRAVYNVPIALRISGVVDVPVLERALRAVVERHSVLRARFIEIDGTPRHVDGDARSATLQTVDLQACPESMREAELMQRLQTEATAPFRLDTEPPFRARLLRVRDDDFALLLVAHHIAFDGWSIAIMLQELAGAYTSFAAGVAPRLPDLPVSYADFATWERRVFAGEPFERLAAYWREKLAGASARLALPFDRARPARESFDGELRVSEIPAEVVSALERLAHQRGATLFMILMAAYQTLLYRYTGQDDIVVGSPLAERSVPETTRLIGYLTHPIAFRARVESETTFSELLAATKAATLEMLDHAAVPLEALLAGAAARGGDGAPPFTTMFVFNNDLATAPNFAGARAMRISLVRELAAFDLSLTVSRTAKGPLRVALMYQTALFDAGTIERMLGHFGQLLESIVSDPSRRLTALPIVGPGERERLIAAGNATAANYPREATLPALFEAQVAARPEATAVVAADASLTYAQLNSRADDVARDLQALGVRPGTFVAVCGDRSSEFVVALLGVLKAGGAYVPLDPEFPPARLALMLTDCRADIVVSDEAQRGLVADVVAAAALHSEAPAPSMYVLGGSASRPPARVPASGATASDSVYGIYTSGSTGRPKGVAVTHRSLVNFLSSMARELDLNARDTVLSVTTFSFDVSGSELWLPLTTGGRLAVAPAAALVDGHRLAELLASSEATVMHATPTTWRLLLAAGWRGTQGLRMISAGEALTQDLAEKLLPNGRALWNAYGPTETTIYSAVGRVRAGEPISLGHPLANTQLYVLEPSDEPAPLGVPGELCIGGDGVARGYLHQPELTADRFVADRFGPIPGAHMYRTGDRVRRHPDGRLEFLGRLDQQVKLRGFRIELGDIEAALAAQPSLQEAAVLLHVPTPDRAELAAYYVPRDTAQQADASPSPASLRAYLRTRLPEYMVPTLFVQLEALPKSPNGKLDRKALPPPDADAARSRSAPFIAPTSATETVLARIFADVLRHEVPIGIDDDFFEAGGHSLLAMQVVARAGTMLRTRLSVRSFFEAPTVRGVAVALARGETAPGRIETVARAVLRLAEMTPEERQRRLDAVEAM